jgi:hypothetical protein
MKSGSLSFILVLAVASVLSVATAAQNLSYSQKLYGIWYTVPLGNPNTDPLRHEFRHNSMTGDDEMVVSRTCAAEGRTVVARAVSPIQVTEDSIRVLKIASETETIQGATECQASITSGVLGYSFSEDGEHLILTNPGGNPDYLELARDTKASEVSTPQRLYGTWLLPLVNGKEMRVQIRWVFYTTAEHQDKVRQIAVCNRGNDSLVSHVDSEIAVSKDQIKVMQSGTSAQQQGNFVCKASLVAGTWRYTLAPSGVTLTLYAEGAKPLTLTREQEPGLN